MIKKNKYIKCPVCHGTNKVKVIKPIAHIFSWHLGKETYEEPCFLCNKKKKNQLSDELKKGCYIPGVDRLN